MYCLRFKDKNFYIFPKCGSTTLIKLCTDVDEYKKHGHSYEHNKCNIYKTIHRCAKHPIVKPDKNLETIIFFRYPHERILSYYNANYKGDMNLNEFVDYIVNRHGLLKNKDLHHHLQKINRRKIKKLKNKRLIHLKNLDRFWLNEFGIDISDIKILNKSKKHNEMPKDLLSKIKIFYKDEYEYLDKNSI